MAISKHKVSRANARTRRSAWTVKLVQLDNVRIRGQEVAIPHRLVKAYQTDHLAVGE